MMSLKSYIEYEKKVTDKLKEKFRSEGINIESIQSYYRYTNENKKYYFDLVILDPNNKISSIYEIKTLNAIKSNSHFIQEQLLTYKKITSANVYLAYLDTSNQLQIEQFEELLINRKNERTQEKTIQSFSEYYETLKQIYKNASDIQYFFRGHSKREYKPIPSIYREANIIQYENKMYREAIQKNPSEFTDNMSTFDNLVKMQHYGLPTRLLDITTNPLVALYFACQENKDNDGKDEDGAVLVFSMLNEQIYNYDSDSVCILSNLAKQSINFSFSKDKGHLIYDIQQDKPIFKGKYLKSGALKEVFCVMPKLNNDRIIRQNGAFFIFGMNQTKNKPAQFKDKPIYLRIKANCKKDILKELQILGIDEATLFPETDKIMKQINAKYKS